MNQIQPSLLPLDLPAARAFEAIAQYFERSYRELPPPRQGQLHLFVRTHSGTAPSAARAWNLGRMVLARAAGDTLMPDQDALLRETQAMHDEVEKAIRSYYDFMGMPNPVGRRPRSETFRESAGALLRDIGLEERGIEVVVDTAPDGQPVVLAMPLDPAMADRKSTRL